MRKNAILEKDSDLEFPHALLISASAGSGKTYTLTKRYVQFILSGKVPANGLENILAVTFTNNAAKEMKTRILEWLKELALNPKSPKFVETAELVDMSEKKIREKAAEAIEMILDDYSNFHIQTIDSFLTRIMSCSVAELNLPLKPDITMTYDKLMEAALYSLFSRIGTEDFKGELIDKFLYVIPKGKTFLWNPVSRIRENFSGFMDEEGRTGREIYFNESENPEKEIRARFAKIMKFCALVEKRVRHSDALKKFYFDARETGNITAFISSYKFNYGIFNGNNKKYFQENWESDKFRLNAMVLKLAEINAKYHYYPYLAVYRRFLTELEKVKSGKDETLHISDIAKKLSSYIKKENVPEIYLKIGEKINHFLVDEFQDTSRLQWDIMRPLIEEALSKRGSLFAVGDVKQAIYMFRNADYRIMKNFLDVSSGKAEAEYLALEPLGGKLEMRNLPVNYRSDGAIVSYVSRLFKERIKSLPELIDEDKTELTTFSQEPIASRLKSGNVETVVMEAESISDGIEKDLLVSKIKESAEKYPLSEIAVLVEKNKRIGNIVEWLTGAGIPVASLSSLDIRKRKVISELLAFSKFLETPADNLSFSVFMLSSVFQKASGLSARKAEEFIFSLGKGEILYAAFKEKFPDIWKKLLDEIFSKVGYLPLYELMALIFSKFSLFENFPKEAAFLSKFMDASIKIEKSGASTLREFVDFASNKDEDAAKLFSVDLPAFLEAVRVMSFHKSKGLGFSAVFNVLYEERKANENMFFKETEKGAEVWHITKDLAEVSDTLKQIYKNKKDSEKIQDLNLLYVISTRARHQMTNIVVKEKPKNSRKEMNLINVFENYKTKGASQVQKKTVEKAPPPLEVFSPDIMEISKGGGKPTLESGKETARGNLVHDILSQIHSDSPGKIYDRRAPLYQFKFKKADIIKTVKDFAESPGIKDFFSRKKGREAKTEMEFIDKNGNLKRMDLVLIEKDLVKVVDFKTGHEDGEYSKQIEEYKAILREVYKKPVKGYIGYVDLKKISEIRD